MADFLDGMDMVMRFLIIRHKSLPLIGPPPGCRSLTLGYPFSDNNKRKNLDMVELLEVIRHDWRPRTSKGYYITGRLNTTIYRDDCLFEGPDPDMPVKGLRKYLNAASQLFDTATSTAELLSLEVSQDDDDDDLTTMSRQHQPRCNGSPSKIVARWRLQGVLHLPWHPSLPVWTGRTVYHFDDDRLIYRHEEFWDISVFQAFTETLLPKVARRIWSHHDDADEAKAKQLQK
jgi:hypothetical protein